MFSVCDVLIVNKMDYIGLSDFDLEALRERVLKLKSDIEIFEMSCKTGKGVDGWADWLRQQVKTFAQLQTP
jgi:hydrogenase nickel incorporation protein HypB